MTTLRRWKGRENREKERDTMRYTLLECLQDLLWQQDFKIFKNWRPVAMPDTVWRDCEWAYVPLPQTFASTDLTYPHGGLALLDFLAKNRSLSTSLNSLRTLTLECIQMLAGDKRRIWFGCKFWGWVAWCRRMLHVWRKRSWHVEPYYLETFVSFEANVRNIWNQFLFRIFYQKKSYFCFLWLF